MGKVCMFMVCEVCCLGRVCVHGEVCCLGGVCVRGRVCCLVGYVSMVGYTALDRNLILLKQGCRAQQMKLMIFHYM